MTNPQAGCDSASNQVVSWTHLQRDFTATSPNSVQRVSSVVRARRFIAGSAAHHAGQTSWSGWLDTQLVSATVSDAEFAGDAGLAVAPDGSATLLFNRALTGSNTEAWQSARLR